MRGRMRKLPNPHTRLFVLLSSAPDPVWKSLSGKREVSVSPTIRMPVADGSIVDYRVPEPAGYRGDVEVGVLNAHVWRASPARSWKP